MIRKKNNKIKFACIEYSTKSGAVWRAKQSKPNYLCDPDKEIDPNSFGAWTSALSGEHIPLSYLKTGLETHTFKYKIRRLSNRFLEKIYQRPIFSNLSYLKKFNLILIILHNYSLPLMARLIKEARKENPHALYLGSIATPLGIMRQTWKKQDMFKAFQNFLNHCNIFINVNRAAQDYLKLITSSSVVYLPQFYPFSYAHKFFQNYNQKEKTILVAGDTNRPDNLAGQFIASQIQKKHPKFLIKIVKMPGLNIKPLKSQGARFKIIPFLPWQKHLKRLSRLFMVINLDITWTLGRLQADCAAVGTPSIGVNSNNQLEMFPKLAVKDIREIDRGVLLGEKLIQDQKFYQEVQKEAEEKIAASNYADSQKRLKAILEKHHSNQ